MLSQFKVVKIIMFVVLNPAETPSNYYSFFWFSWVSLVAKEDIPKSTKSAF